MKLSPDTKYHPVIIKMKTDKPRLLFLTFIGKKLDCYRTVASSGRLVTKMIEQPWQAIFGAGQKKTAAGDEQGTKYAELLIRNLRNLVSHWVPLGAVISMIASSLEPYPTSSVCSIHYLSNI